jgi:formate dehydrogenase
MNIAAKDITESEAGTVTKKTFCRICGCFCGIDVTTDGDKIVKVEPDKTHPYSWRDFCSKAGNAGNLRDHPDRLTTPMKRVGDKYVEATYEEAIADIAARLNKIRKDCGPNAIATYTGNPGATNSTGVMFMGGFTAALGTQNNYKVGSIDQNNYHLVANRMYGSDFACLNIDIDHTNCFLFIGMNPAVSTLGWMYFSPLGWKRVLDAQKRGADLIMVDPRRTQSTRKANTHIAIQPGQDWALLLGIIKVIFEAGWQNVEDCDDAVGVDVVRQIAEEVSLERLSSICRVSVDQIRDVARRFATAETAACLTQTGVALNRNGTIGHWLGHVLNLITGRIDRKGGLYYQPGIFENTMAVINGMSPPVERLSRIGNHRAVAGGYPLAILPDEITTPGQDQIKALFLNAGNPVISGPDGEKLDQALQQLDLLVAIDFFQRESHRHAHWLIPAPHFLERDDFLAMLGVIYEQPFAQLGQAAIAPRNGIRHEWQFFLDLSLAMNIPFMAMPRLNTMVKASRWLAKLTGKPGHAFNPHWLWSKLVKKMGRVKWQDLKENPQGFFYGEKQYGLFRALLQTEDGKIHAAPAEFVEVLQRRLQEPLPATDTNFPYQMVNSRRESMMNSWLVETNFQRRQYGEFVEINPDDAAGKGILDGQAVRVSSRIGAIELKASISDDMPRGIVSMDHGWGSRLFDPRSGETLTVHGVNRNLLVPGDELDELAGTPTMNGIYVNIAAA